MRVFRAAVFFSLVGLTIIGACREAAVPAADLVIVNARILTSDPENPQAEAVAVREGKIEAVGNSSEIMRRVRDGVTEVFDAGGALVTPGFNDAHTHFGSLDPDYIDLRYITDGAEITRRVKEKAREVRPGELIRGGHWEHEMFHDRAWPTRDLIDPFTPDNPVVLSRADGHSILVNRYVLETSGISRDTPDPFGGEIVRDPRSGEPTGILKESARRMIRTGAVDVERTPEEEAARRGRGWQAAVDLAARLGVTTVQVVAASALRSGHTGWEAYQRFLDEDRASLRLYFSGVLTADEAALEEYEDLRRRFPLSGEWIRFGPLKGFIDGTLGSGTMLVFDPFDDAPDRTGLPQMPYPELEKRVLAADRHGFQVAIHAIGDRANRWVLDAYARAREVNGVRDSRHRIEHAQILHPDDIPRFAELGVVASMQPTHCITDKRFAEKRIGRERCRGAYAWRSLLDSGASIAFGTDYSVEPLDPVEGLYAAVTRKDRAGEEGEGWFPEQKLSLEEAVRLYTLGSAHAEFMEDRKGMLRPGYLADLVVFDRDLTTVPPEDILRSRVKLTVVGGRVVFRAGSGESP